MSISLAPLSLVAALITAIIVAITIFVASTAPSGVLTPAELPKAGWTLWGGFTSQAPKLGMAKKYNITAQELRTILDPEPGIPVVDYVLDASDGDIERANATLYERAAEIATEATSSKAKEPWLTWAQPRFSDGGMQTLY